MATNSDGSIVLSVKIDDSNIKPQLSKLKSEIEDMAKRTDKVATSFSKVNTELIKAELQNEKLKQAQEKTAQSVEKTYQAIEKTNQAKLKTSQLDDKTILSAEKVSQAELKTAQQQEKLNAEKAKAAQQSAKQAQEEAKVYTEVFKASSAREKANQAAEKTFQAVEKTKQAEESTRQAFEKTAQSQQKTTQETEKTKQSQEKTKQAVEKTTQAQNKTTEAINKSKKATNSWKSATNNITSALGKMATTLGIVFGIRELLRFSNEASKVAAQTEAYILRIGQIYGEAGKQVSDFIDANSQALGMSKTAAYEAASSYGNLFSSFANGAENARLTNDMLQTTAAIASKTGRTFDEVFAKIQSGIFGNTRAIDDLGVYVNQATITTTKAFQTISDGRPWAQLTGNEQKQILTLAILEQSQAKYGNTVLQSTALTRSQFNAAFQDFKATWGQVVNVVLMPVLRVISTILSYATLALKTLLKFFGKDVNFSAGAGAGISAMNADSAGVADNLGEASDNQKKLGKGVKDTNKELKKTLAGFDELEILTNNVSDNAGGNSGTSTAGGAGGGLDVGNVDTTGSEKTEMIDVAGSVAPWKTAIASLVGMLVGTGLVALGIILCSIGHPKWGIAAIVAGLLAIGASAVTLGETLDIEGARVALTLITAITGIICIVLGIILCVSGAIPWGIGAIAFGLGMLGAAAYAIGEKMNPEEAKTALAGLAAFVGGALLAIGVLLCFVGSIPWGVAAIVAGVAALGFSASNLSQTDEEGIKNWLLAIELAAGGAMLALGILLCWLTGPSPISIGLIIAGAATLVFALANIDKSAVSEGVKNWINIIFAIVSVAFLVIGCIMAFTGQVTPLSIGLIVAGAAGLVAEISVNWDWLKETLQGKIGVITTIVSAALLALGIIICFCSAGTALPLGIGLIVVGAAGLATEIAVNWDFIKEKVSGAFNTIKNWVSTWGLLVLGIVLCFTGIGIPIGIALMKKGADNLASKEDPIWDTMVTKIKDAWQSVKDFWKNNVAKYFTANYWKNLGTKMVSGLIKTVINGINKLINKVNSFGFNLPEVLGGGRIGFNIPKLSVPALAQGAVLPANSPFLAVLGDQKKGTNIEAPAELIKQMAMEAIIEANANNQGQTVKEEHYYLDQTELMSILYKLVKGGERLKGNSLLN